MSEPAHRKPASLPSPTMPSRVVQRAQGSAASLDSEAREDGRVFLQQRLAAFGRLLALTFSIFLIWRVITTLVGDAEPSRAYLPWQAMAVASFGTTWLVCRAHARSLRFLRVTEAACLCGAASGAIMMCWRMSYMARPDSVLLLCLTYTLIVRAIMVPSSPRRTLGYGVLFALPFLVSVYLIHLFRHDPAHYTALADPRLHDAAATMARRWTMVAALWWAASQVIATSTSQVIYGLRRAVRDARRLGQYTLTEKLGQGGMGVVYLARHALLRRPSAIKLLPPERFGAESALRFEREVQLTASLSHPNTIRVFDYGRTPDGIFYYVMEYLDGASLDEVIALSGPMPAARVLNLLDQVTGALREAHAIGLIHRDIKPANIFLTMQGGVPDVAKVLDFGLVKQLHEVTGEGSTVEAVTRDDTISGTPLYMAPESITSPESIDARTDLYALGAVGYYLLTGLDVFGGRNVLEVCGHHLHSEPIPPSRRSGRLIPEDLEALILACLRKLPAERPRDAATLQAQLRACRDARGWDEESARAWFVEHGDALRARSSRSTVSGAATIAIDLGRRL